MGSLAFSSGASDLSQIWHAADMGTGRTGNRGSIDIYKEENENPFWNRRSGLFHAIPDVGIRPKLQMGLPFLQVLLCVGVRA